MKIPRNEPCPCASGKKYKKCCSLKEQSVALQLIDELSQKAPDQDTLKTPDQQVDFFALCNQVIDQVNQEDFAAAKQNLDQLAIDHAQSYYFNYVMGLYLAKTNEIALAINHFENAIRVYPLFAEAYYNLGHAYFLQDDLSKAVACLKKVLEIEKIDAKNPELLQATHEMLKNLSDAVRVEYSCNLDQYINFLGLVERGDTCFAADKYDKAILLFKQALEIVPTIIDLYKKIAFAYHKLNDAQRASQYFSTAMYLENMHEQYNNQAVQPNEQVDPALAININEQQAQL